MSAFQFMDATSGELREIKTIGVVLPEVCLVCPFVWSQNLV